MTLGEFRVGISFNPSSNPRVDAIKGQAAELIDLCSTFDVADPEVQRLLVLAMERFEEGAMWAVKAVTKKLSELDK